MIKHETTESTEINFQKLEERIIAINNQEAASLMKEFLYSLIESDKPTLIMATGGSKVVALYLQLLLEHYGLSGMITEVIEPRDYFYKTDRYRFTNLVIVSASGNTNGINEALNDFKGNKFLITEKPKEQMNTEVIVWGNKFFDSEKSFISLATSLGPISLMLASTDAITLAGVSPLTIIQINEKISQLIKKAQEKMSNLQIDFQNLNLVQIISGYDTKTSSAVLESNLVETGICTPVIHDKGSFCHGRSNLLFQNPSSPIVYLRHDFTSKLDETLITLLKKEYSNFLELKPILTSENIFWQEYDLILQMYYLSKKIAEDKHVDLTMPEYNPRLVRSLYRYKGEM